MKLFQMYSPNMLKIYSQCPRKFKFRYIENITMPINDEIFEFGKFIHALASYYLKGENIDKMEKTLRDSELNTWQYLKSVEQFEYEVVEVEHQINVRVGEYLFGGRIDAIVKKDECYYILDYKTGGAPQNAVYDFQTMIYMLAVSKFYNTKNVSFIYIDLKNKKNVQIDFTDVLASDYESRLIQEVKKMENSAISAKKTDCCCEYSKICF